MVLLTIVVAVVILIAQFKREEDDEEWEEDITEEDDEESFGNKNILKPSVIENMISQILIPSKRRLYGVHAFDRRDLSAMNMIIELPRTLQIEEGMGKMASNSCWEPESSVYISWLVKLILFTFSSNGDQT